MKTKIKVQILLSIIVTTSFGIWLAYDMAKTNRLESDHTMAACTVSNCSLAGRGNSGMTKIEFEYVVNGKRIISSNFTGEIRIGPCNKYLLGRNFPMIYLPSDPDVARVLITPSDFQRLNLPYPDSLADLPDKIYGKERNNAMRLPLMAYALFFSRLAPCWR